MRSMQLVVSGQWSLFSDQKNEIWNSVIGIWDL